MKKINNQWILKKKSKIIYNYIGINKIIYRNLSSINKIKILIQLVYSIAFKNKQIKKKQNKMMINK